jgi:hypothetical protein
VPTPWCPNLAAALNERRVVVHEEGVAELLLNDLQRQTAETAIHQPDRLGKGHVGYKTVNMRVSSKPEKNKVGT